VKKMLSGLAVVAVVAFAFVGGVYDYSVLIAVGTLLTDLALMITAALTIAVGVKFAFIAARFFGRAVRLIK